MFDPWTFTASAQRMRERDIARMPMYQEPETIGLAPALAIAAALAVLGGGGSYAVMLLCVNLFGGQ